MTLIRPKSPAPSRDRPVDRATTASPTSTGPRRESAVKDILAEWIAGHPGAGLASAAAVGAAVGRLLKRR